MNQVSLGHEAKGVWGEVGWGEGEKESETDRGREWGEEEEREGGRRRGKERERGRQSQGERECALSLCSGIITRRFFKVTNHLPKLLQVCTGSMIFFLG